MLPTNTKHNISRSKKNILIHPTLQREFALLMFVTIFSAGFFVVGIIHFTLNDLIRGLPDRVPKALLQTIIEDAGSRMALSSLAIIFFAVIVAGVFAILFLHRIAGPVYRFHKTIADLADGKSPEKIKIRKNDFFVETEEEINRLIDTLDKDRNKQ